jgi:hypothetical protein
MLLALVLLTAGCGSVERTGGPEPGPQSVERHLVYEKVLGEKGIWIADVDGSHARLLVREADSPELSPDGKWVVYLDDSVGNLYLAPTAGGKPKLLARGLYTQPAWSPDSERIAARLESDEVSDQGPPRGSEKLVSIDVASGKEATLTHGDSAWGWSFSPDGKRIVYGMSRGSSPDHFNGSNIDLFISGRDGGDAKQITDTGDNGYPVWGPKSIAFAKLIPYNGWGRHEIWRVQPDGTGRTSITGSLPRRLLMQGCVGLAPIDWSDDGRALLAAWLCEFSDEPVAVDLGTGAIRDLGWGSDTVALSRDGRSALVQAHFGAETPPEEQKVMILDYDGGKPTLVARGAVAPSWNR